MSGSAGGVAAGPERRGVVDGDDDAGVGGQLRSVDVRVHGDQRAGPDINFSDQLKHFLTDESAGSSDKALQKVLRLS